MNGLKPEALPADVDTSTFQGRLEDALKTQDKHQGLVAYANELLAGRYNEGQVLGILEAFREHLREQDRESDEDAVMDVMDRLVGWCAPQAILQRERMHVNQ